MVLGNRKPNQDLVGGEEDSIYIYIYRLAGGAIDFPIAKTIAQAPIYPLA